MTISDKELDRLHDENCEYIMQAIESVNFDTAIDWRKVKIKIDEKSAYILKKERENDRTANKR